jgi:hypothetical protein
LLEYLGAGFGDAGNLAKLIILGPFEEVPVCSKVCIPYLILSLYCGSFACQDYSSGVVN